MMVLGMCYTPVDLNTNDSVRTEMMRRGAGYWHLPRIAT